LATTMVVFVVAVGAFFFLFFGGPLQCITRNKSQQTTMLCKGLHKSNMKRKRT
jgi:hypothetical protein